MVMSQKTLQNKIGKLKKDNEIFLLYGWEFIPGTRGKYSKPSRFVRKPHEDMIWSKTMMFNPEGSKDWKRFHAA